METRYSVRTPSEFSGTALEVVQHLHQSKTHGDVTITNERFPGISIICNLSKGTVITDDHTQGGVKNSYPDLIRPIETAISDIVKAELYSRLKEIANPDIQKNIDSQLPGRWSLVNFSLFQPKENSQINVGSRTFDLKSLDVVDKIIHAANEVSVQSKSKLPNLGMN